MNFFSSRYFLFNLIILISYFLLAKAGFAWGALTSNATLLWPPSGLVLYILLAHNNRGLAGLFIGAFAAIQYLSLGQSLGYNLFSFFIAGIMATASVLQGWLVAITSRHLFAKGFRVNSRAAFLFSARILLCCVISASVSNYLLWQTGIIQLSIALQNWALWWMGDSIGMLLVGSLLLWLFERKNLQTNTQAHAFFIFCAGIGTVLLVVSAIGHNERQNSKRNLQHQATTLVSIMQTQLDLALRDLETFQYYYLNNTFSRDDLKTITEPLLNRTDWLESFTVQPLNNGNTALDFVEGLRIARTSDGTLQWSQVDNQYITPALLADPDKPLAISNSELVWRKEQSNPPTDYNSPFISLLHSLRNCSRNNKNSCNAYYLIAVELNLNDLMRSSINKLQKPELELRLSIPQANHKNSILIWTNDHWQESLTPNTTNYEKAPIFIEGKIPQLNVLNSQWQLLIAPTDLSIWFLPSKFQLFILAVGLLLTLLFTAYLHILHRHDLLIIENQRRLEDEITQQTQALRKANEWLLAEMAEKKNTQDQLKSSESHLRTLINNIPDPIWFKSNEGAYLSFNKAVEPIFNTGRDQVIGKSLSDFTSGELEQKIAEFEKEALASANAIRKQLWMYLPAYNQERLMDTIKIAVRDEQQQSLGILSIARDITEQHELIVELEKFKRFAEFSDQGFGITNLRGDILYMNPCLQTMLENKLTSDFSQKKFIQYYPERLHEKITTEIVPAVINDGRWEGELIAKHTDGSEFPTHETFFIIRDDNNQPLYIGDVIIDISERKEIEQALKLAKETAEEATHAKSRFLANMSHEIRTPLNAVLGYSQLLIADQQLLPQQRERMNAILNAGQRLLHLINDVLDLSKIEAGALHLRSDYFDLHKEMRDIILLMANKANNKGLAFEHVIDLPNPSIVKTDQQKLGQIILNLLGNAIKFTQSGAINFTVKQEGSLIHFSVVDTGPGIAAQELQQLFAAFKQGKSGEDSGGTGLGLVISKHIAEHMGGELTLDSEAGKGTRAHLRLPLIIEHNAQLAIAPNVEKVHIANGETCNVLVVEDDLASRDVLVNLLRNIGCTVRAAENGQLGLHEVQTNMPDIIFTDIRMPVMNGNDMLSALRELFSKKELPVIAVSASSLEHERTFYLAQGFHEFIGKPYQFSDVYRALTRFTKAHFIIENNSTQSAASDNKIDWKNNPATAQCQQQFEILRAALHEGDMGTSKKLFAQQSAENMGTIAYQQIQTAIRQYDLVLAEKRVRELLDEIAAAIPSAT